MLARANSNGNLTTATDPLNHVTTTTYDSRNRMKGVTEASGTTFARTTTYTYGDKINVTQIDKPDGTSETKTYDEMNRLLTDTVPQTSSATIGTKFVYNPSGTLYSVTDGNLHWTKFQYDESDRKIEMDYQSGDTQKRSYDGAGNPSRGRGQSSLLTQTSSHPQTILRKSFGNAISTQAELGPTIYSITSFARDAARQLRVRGQIRRADR
jgi:YD repeat-containing protein